MTSDLPSVSVIIPVFNGERYLSAAIESVLAQNHQPVEIIVIDDGSTDGSAGLARIAAPAVRVITQPNTGPAAARNRGIALTTGELLAFLDADDWWHPQKLHHQIECFVQAPELGYVLCHMRTQLEAGAVWPVALNQAHYQNEPPCFLPSALVVRRDILQQVGLFDENYRYSEDTDWFLRAKELGIPMSVVPKTLVTKRIHAANLSLTPGVAQTTLRAFRTSLQRQRQQHQKAMVHAA